MSMFTLTSDFQHLFTEAKTAPSTEQRLNALQRALELCNNKDLSLTSQVFFQFLEFVHSSDPQIRKWVTKTVEIVCKQHPHIQLLQAGLSTLLTLSRDDNIHVIKRALISITNLIPPTLQFTVETDNSDVEKLRGVIRDLKQQMIGYLSSQVSDVCIYAIRFVYVVVRWCVEHEQIEERDRLLNVLCSALTTPTSLTPSALIVLVHSLSNLGLLRAPTPSTSSLMTITSTSTPSSSASSTSLVPSRPLLSRVVDSLLTFYTTTLTSVPTFRYSSNLRSVQHALKFALLRLVKVLPPSPQQERVQETLQTLGVHSSADPLPPALDLFGTESPENHTRENAKRKFSEIENEAVVNSDHESAKKLKVVTPLTPPSVLSAAATLTQMLVSLLPYDRLVALVCETLNAPLPPPPPTTHTPLTLGQFITALQTGTLPSHALVPLSTVGTSLSRTDPRKDPRLVTQLPNTTNTTNSTSTSLSVPSSQLSTTPPSPPPTTTTTTSPPLSSSVIPLIASTMPTPVSSSPLTPELIAQITQRQQLTIPNLNSQTIVQLLTQQLAPSTLSSSLSSVPTQSTTSVSIKSSESIEQNALISPTTTNSSTSSDNVSVVATESGSFVTSASAVKKVTASAKSRDIRVSTQLHEVTPLSREAMRELGVHCFMRVLNLQNVSGARHVRETVLSVLASKQPLDSEVVKQFLDHLVTHFPASSIIQLTLTWLTREFLSEFSRYSVLLRDLFQRIQSKVNAKDKVTLSTLLLHLPTLTSDVFAFLDALCRFSDARMKLGLSLLRDIVLYRVSETRKTALDMLLDYTTHHDKTLRTQAIRLVSNKLFPLKLFASYIEQVATARLESLASDTRQNSESATEKAEEAEEEQIKRQILLYLALCAKKPSLLHGIVKVYVACGTRLSVRKVIHSQIVDLVRVIGVQSPHLLQLFAECPRGAESLLLVILHAFTDTSQSLPPALVQTIKRAYAENRLDSRFLIPLLPSLTKKEVIDSLPALVQLPSNVLKTVIHRLLNSKPTLLTPAELLIALHQIQDEKLLKKVVEATQYCFEQSVIVKQDVLAIVLQQLLQVSPLPTLYMRTVIQAITKVKPMASFVLSNILTKLITKQIWNDKRLWEGFVKCIKMTLPNSVPIILQLPPAQFEEFAQNPEIREQIILYQKKYNKPLPKSLQDVLDKFSNKSTND